MSTITRNYELAKLSTGELSSYLSLFDFDNEYNNIFVDIARGEGFRELKAIYGDGRMVYKYVLNINGIKIAHKSAQSRGFDIVPHTGEFYDDDETSIEATLSNFDITTEELFEIPKDCISYHKDGNITDINFEILGVDGRSYSGLIKTEGNDGNPDNLWVRIESTDSSRPEVIDLEMGQDIPGFIRTTFEQSNIDHQVIAELIKNVFGFSIPFNTSN